MKKVRLSLLVEPAGNLYLDLVDYATSQCEIALLVVQSTLHLDPGGKWVLDQLAPFLNQKMESSEWPGTRLFGKTAWVYHYNLGPECAAVLKRTTGALFDWTQPKLPEDLCFLRGDGEPWLVSIAHERDAFLYLSEEEKLRLFDALPMFEPLVDESG